MKLTLESRKVNHIPILDVYDPDTSKSSPIIILLHGIPGRKEHLLSQAYYFARRGFYVTLFDAYQQGDLEPEEFQSLDFYQKMALSGQVFQETMKFIDQIIADHVQTQLADSSRIGLTGISGGGSIIYKYLARPLPPSLKAAVPIIASPKVGDSLKRIYQNDPKAANCFAVFEATCKMDQEAYPKLLTLNNFPLLMLNGTKDPQILVDGVRQCYHEMKPNYQDPGKINFIEYPEVGHQVTDEMMAEACGWFERYL